MRCTTIAEAVLSSENNGINDNHDELEKAREPHKVTNPSNKSWNMPTGRFGKASNTTINKNKLMCKHDGTLRL